MQFKGTIHLGKYYFFIPKREKMLTKKFSKVIGSLPQEIRNLITSFITSEQVTPGMRREVFENYEQLIDRNTPSCNQLAIYVFEKLLKYEYSYSIRLQLFDLLSDLYLRLNIKAKSATYCSMKFQELYNYAHSPHSPKNNALLYDLAECYYYGHGTPQSFQQAIQILTKVQTNYSLELLVKAYLETEDTRYEEKTIEILVELMRQKESIDFSVHQMEVLYEKFFDGNGERLLGCLYENRYLENNLVTLIKRLLENEKFDLANNLIETICSERFASSFANINWFFSIKLILEWSFYKEPNGEELREKWDLDLDSCPFIDWDSIKLNELTDKAITPYKNRINLATQIYNLFIKGRRLFIDSFHEYLPIFFNCPYPNLQSGAFECAFDLMEALFAEPVHNINGTVIRYHLSPKWIPFAISEYARLFSNHLIMGTDTDVLGYKFSTLLFGEPKLGREILNKLVKRFTRIAISKHQLNYNKFDDDEIKLRLLNFLEAIYSEDYPEFNNNHKYSWDRLLELGFELKLPYCYDIVAEQYLFSNHNKNSNPKKAVHFLQYAASHGDSRAMMVLGACYKSGVGIEKNLIKASQWLTRAADQGNLLARRWLVSVEREYKSLEQIAKSEQPYNNTTNIRQDSANSVFTEKNNEQNRRCICLDTETTGLSNSDRICEIAAVEFDPHTYKVIRRFHSYVNPGIPMPYSAYYIHGLSDNFLEDKPVFSEIVNPLISFIQGATIYIHNAKFDTRMLNQEFSRLGLRTFESYCQSIHCTLQMARTKFGQGNNCLDDLCKKFNVDNSGRNYHGALLDSELLVQVLKGLQTK